MLTLKLEALFTPQLLQAYRETWGPNSGDANELAREIIGMFENPGSEKQHLLTSVALALVGDEPDLRAWMEALAVGSFELRPDVTYGRAPRKGSPARFIRRQREMIESQIDKRLPAAERELCRLAYQDALRLIVASMFIRELRKGVAAKSAIGTGWPIMVAVTDHLLVAEKRVLHHLGGDPAFRKHLAKSISDGIQGWSDMKFRDETPATDGPEDYKGQLSPGVDADAARAYIRRRPLAAGEHEPPTVQQLGSQVDLDQPTDGINRLTDDLAGGSGAMSPQSVNADQAAHDGEWRYFEEARSENTPFEYDTSLINKLRLCLPTVFSSEPDSLEFIQAATRAQSRRAERAERPELCHNLELQIEIERWAAAGLPPPSLLIRQNASLLEEEICEACALAKPWDARWKTLLGFEPRVPV